jgi:hypothetical protein
MNKRKSKRKKKRLHKKTKRKRMMKRKTRKKERKTRKKVRKTSKKEIKTRKKDKRLRKRFLLTSQIQMTKLMYSLLRSIKTLKEANTLLNTLIKIPMTRTKTTMSTAESKSFVRHTMVPQLLKHAT